MIFGPQYCRACKKNTIELYDYFNNIMGYKYISKEFIEGKPPRDVFDKRTVYTLRCRSCGKAFPIRWVRGYPVPNLYEDYYENFMDNFKEMSKK